MKRGVIVNPKSGRSGKGLALARMLKGHPQIVLRVLEDFTSLPPILDEMSAADVDELFISSGDGTVHAVQTDLAERRPFAVLPQLALLPHMQAVVCHGGHNTVCEALAQGLPLVVLPIKDDQPVVAEQVAGAGAGLRLKFGRVRPAELREAVLRVLGDPSFRDAAAKVARSFAAAGGAPRAASLLLELA